MHTHSRKKRASADNVAPYSAQQKVPTATPGQRSSVYCYHSQIQIDSEPPLAQRLPNLPESEIYSQLQEFEKLVDEVRCSPPGRQAGADGAGAVRVMQSLAKARIEYNATRFSPVTASFSARVRHGFPLANPRPGAQVCCA